MPEPLTLECYCPEDLGTTVSGCTIYDIVWHSSGSVINHPYGLHYRIELLSDMPDMPPTLLYSGETASMDVSLGAGFADYWETAVVHLSLTESLIQLLDPASYAQFGAQWSLEVIYRCSDGAGGFFTRSVGACNQGTDQVKCYDDGSLWQALAIGPCGGGGTLFRSASLGTCASLDLYSGDFQPPPGTGTIDVKHSGMVCLCASGGTPQYTFFIKSGRLPAGQALNPQTGCIEGEATGPGSDTVVFGVVDRDGNEAETTCTLIAPCDCQERVDAAIGNDFS